MPSSTARLQIPYPLPTDQVSEGANDMKAMADRLDAVVGKAGGSLRWNPAMGPVFSWTDWAMYGIDGPNIQRSTSGIWVVLAACYAAITGDAGVNVRLYAVPHPRPANGNPVPANAMLLQSHESAAGGAWRGGGNGEVRFQMQGLTAPLGMNPIPAGENWAIFPAVAMVGNPPFSAQIAFDFILFELFDLSAGGITRDDPTLLPGPGPEPAPLPAE